MRVLVAMSGGVDSSVCALLLKRAGHEVAGATMRLWSDDHAYESCRPSGGCCGMEAIEDARRVCCAIDVPHYVLNYKNEFKKHVVKPFINSYLKGETPNPCVECNKNLKFNLMLNQAVGMGFDAIATGHYAKIVRSEGKYQLWRSEHNRKDQSYALYMLNQKQLPYILMPLGEYSKEQVRNLAKDAGLPVFNKPDSQEICFIEDGDYAGFIERHTNKSVGGQIVNSLGEPVGWHDGIWRYTIGQRKGLGSHKSPMYVTDINGETNTITIGGDLFSNHLSARYCVFISGQAPEQPTEIEAKIRYSAEPAVALLSVFEDSTASVIFEKPQRAITPGQSVVFYNDRMVLGGGIITRSPSNSAP